MSNGLLRAYQQSFCEAIWCGKECKEAYLCAVLGGVQVDLEGPMGKGAVIPQVTELLVGIVRARLGHIPAKQQYAPSGRG